MERRQEKYQQLQHALTTLYESLEDLQSQESAVRRTYKTYRDSVIQRFEYTVELFWKYLKGDLHYQGLVSVATGSPKDVVRMALEAKLISESEAFALLKALADRNLTSHIYHEVTAELLKEAVPHHYTVMKTIAERLKP